LLTYLDRHSVRCIPHTWIIWPQHTTQCSYSSVFACLCVVQAVQVSLSSLTIGMATHAAVQTTAVACRLLALAALAIAFLAVSSNAQQQLVVANPTGDNLRAANQRGLLADDTAVPGVTVVARKNITKTELLKLLDEGVAPKFLPAGVEKSTAAGVTPSNGRKLSQQTGLCGGIPYFCGTGCSLWCSGSIGLCFRNAWRCSGSSNIWTCPCGRRLGCYYSNNTLFAVACII